MFDEKLKDKRAIVTGASRGIGRAIALAFGEEGAHVVVNYNHSRVLAEGVVKEIVERGGKALAVKADVSKKNEILHMVDKAIATFGRIDILVNNAGLTPAYFFRDGKLPSFEEIGQKEWNTWMDTNVKSAFLCSQVVGKIMMKQQFGAIINLSSISGYALEASLSVPYCATKQAIRGLTAALAVNLSPCVRVNSIAPGFILTELPASFPRKLFKSLSELSQLKRAGRPEEVARVVVFLASDDSSFVNAQTIIVDGGILAT